MVVRPGCRLRATLPRMFSGTATGSSGGGWGIKVTCRCARCGTQFTTFSDRMEGARRLDTQKGDGFLEHTMESRKRCADCDCAQVKLRLGFG